MKRELCGELSPHPGGCCRTPRKLQGWREQRMRMKLPWQWVGCGQSLRFGKSILGLWSFSAVGTSVNLSHLSYTPKKRSFHSMFIWHWRKQALRLSPLGGLWAFPGSKSSHQNQGPYEMVEIGAARLTGGWGEQWPLTAMHKLEWRQSTCPKESWLSLSRFTSTPIETGGW